MGESPSARTQRELADLRGAIDKDVDALLAHARSDADPRNLIRRQPLAVLGSIGSVAAAAAVGIASRARESKKAEVRLEAMIDHVGGSIDRLKGKARKRFRKQLQKELSEVEGSSPRDAAIEAMSGALTAMATTMAAGFAKRLLGDEHSDEETRR